MHLKCLWKSKQLFNSGWKTKQSFTGSHNSSIAFACPVLQPQLPFFVTDVSFMQYLGSTQRSVRSPEVLREEILTAWHCLCATCPSFLLCTVQKVQGMSSASSCTSHSTDPFLLTSPTWFRLIYSVHK